MKSTSQRESSSSGTGNQLFALGIATIFLGGGYLLYDKNKKKSDSQEEAAKLAQDEPSRQASMINFYIGAWYQKPNVTELVNIARNIKDWPAVVNAYAKLYNGENLEESVRTSLQKWGGYGEFISALSKKGLPGTKTDNVVVKPVETGTKKGDKVLVDDSRYAVDYYKDWRDYPVKKLASVPKGKIDPNKRAVIFLQSLEASYANSPVKTTLYQIQLANGSQVWINRDRNIMRKKAVSGLYAPLQLTQIDIG